MKADDIRAKMLQLRGWRSVIMLAQLLAPPASAEWAFVNNAGETNAGPLLLSAEMAQSQAGYTLVDAGSSYGILINPDGGLTAVQQVDLASGRTGEAKGRASPSVQSEAATGELRNALSAAKLKRLSLHASCPTDADAASCQAWCEAVVVPTGDGLQGILVGPPCAEQGSVSKVAAATNCSCHRHGVSALLASCRSICRLDGSMQAHGRSPVAAPPKKRRQERIIPRTDSSLAPSTTTLPPDLTSPQGSVSNKANSPTTGSTSTSGGIAASTGTNKEASAAAGRSTTMDTAAAPARYLLYDTRYGTSFGTQVDVLFTAIRIVTVFNNIVTAACGSQFAGTRCMPWMLVLPPWCAVVHWYSDSSPMLWKELYDVETLKKQVPIIEFDEYTRLTGSGRDQDASVDFAALLALSSGSQQGRADFHGWQGPHACQAAGQTLPQRSQSKGGMSLVFSGYCDGDMRVKEFQCGLLKHTSRAAVEGMYAEMPEGARSVLLKHLDAVPFPEGSSKTKQLHSALRPASALTKAGNLFITETLGDLPYLAAHVRRNDLVRSHPEFTPGPEEVAARLNFLLKELDLDQVFVATDGRPSFCETLRRRVKAPLYFFARDDGARPPGHKGKEAVTVLGILARATHFVGTSVSSFTSLVHRERRRLGKAAASEEVFCKGLTGSEAGRRCKLEQTA